MTSTTLIGGARHGMVPALSDDAMIDLHALLEEQRDFRLEQLAQLHRPDPHGPLSSSNPEIFRSLADGARAALTDVQSALWRMEDGRYGQCIACGQPMEIARLEILPQVARCMPCQRSYSAGQATSRTTPGVV
jgi:DnaK suppressor protein